MSNEIVIAIIGSLGLGGIITSLISQLINKNNAAQESRKAKMRERYMAIMILMFARLDPDKELKYLRNHRPEITSLKDLENELDLEVLNSTIFANDKVIKSLYAFTKNPTKENYLKVALEMRKNLWGSKTRITIEDLGNM